MATNKVISDSEGKDYTEEFLKNYQHSEEGGDHFPKIIKQEILTNNNSKLHSQTGMNFIIKA